jgi:hypothetical protein
MNDDVYVFSSDEEIEENKAEGATVARPTTKPTDRTKKLAKQASSYTFWKEKDPEKLASY